MERKVFMENVIKETDHGPVLIAQKCKKCGEIVFPATAELCTNCLGEEFDIIDLSQNGKLKSYTVHYRPVNTPFPVPHALAQVELPEGVTIYAPLKIEGEMVPGHEFVSGSDVELIEDDYYTVGDVTTYGYKFKVVK